eukprot:SAG25_NODE_562_length_6909_cov_2.841557_4_plen_72_part_00
MPAVLIPTAPRSPAVWDRYQLLGPEQQQACELLEIDEETWCVRAAAATASIAALPSFLGVRGCEGRGEAVG